MSEIPECLIVKDWFASKVFDEAPYWVTDFSLTIKPDQILKESEKAFLVRFNGDTPRTRTPTGFAMWVPKKAVGTPAEIKAEEQEREQRMAERFKAGAERHDRLVQLAKDHGIKGVRKTLRTNTLLEMLRKAGVEVTA